MLLLALDSLWPWLAVAGLGALHGLSPASGWMVAACWGLREGNAAGAWTAIPTIAIGHATSIAMAVFLYDHGATLDPVLFRIAAGTLLVVAAAACLRGGAGAQRQLQAEAGHAGLALWSFLMGSAHGAGLMLMPALLPMCLDSGTAPGITGAGSLAPALAAMLLHTVAMLLATGVIASGVCHGVSRRPGLLQRAASRKAWLVVLAVCGTLLVA